MDTEIMNRIYDTLVKSTQNPQFNPNDCDSEAYFYVDTAKGHLRMYFSIDGIAYKLSLTRE